MHRITCSKLILLDVNLLFIQEYYNAILSVPNYLFQMKKMKFMLQVVNKPQMVEQAGRSTAENCLTVILTSLAMVRDKSFFLFGEKNACL